MREYVSCWWSGICPTPRTLIGMALILAGPLAYSFAGEAPGCPALTRIRFYPAEGQAVRMLHGRFTGSNEGATTGFETLAEVKEIPKERQWTEIRLTGPVRYRFIKYEAPQGSWGNVAEIEFYADNQKITGTPFGTTGSRDNNGRDYSKAVDGDVSTFFDGMEPNNQYVGLDLGASAQAAAPEFAPQPGAYPQPQSISITSATPGFRIRLTRGGGTPTRDQGDALNGAVRLEKSEVLAAVAYTENLACSPVVVAPYRIGQQETGARVTRTFHIGNSLTDTVDGWLIPVAESGGHSLDFHRFTIPGAPTDWLWAHPASGFGDSRYAEAFFAFAPFDDSSAFASLFDLQRKSVDMLALEYQQWRAASALRNHDPSLLVRFDFEDIGPSGWTLHNVAAGDGPAVDAAIVGCQATEGRWPAKRALEFRSMSDRVRFSVPGEFQALTLSAWVNVKGLDREFNSLCMCDGFGSGKIHWQIRNDGVLDLGLQGARPRQVEIFASPPVIDFNQFGQWMHLAVVVDGPNRQVVHYVKGTPVSRHAVRRPPPYRIGLAELGNWNPGDFPNKPPALIRHFSGAMDEFALFSRALSDAEIQALHSEGKPQPDP